MILYFLNGPEILLRLCSKVFASPDSVQFSTKHNFIKKYLIMAESEIKKVSKYLKLSIGKLSYTDDNIIQMKTSGEDKVVGFSSILNYLHNIIEKENRTTENYFLTKQFFDYANQFVRNTSKRDKCES